jgi:hypothetical protein
MLKQMTGPVGTASWYDGMMGRLRAENGCGGGLFAFGYPFVPVTQNERIAIILSLSLDF